MAKANNNQAELLADVFARLLSLRQTREQEQENEPAADNNQPSEALSGNPHDVSEVDER